MVMSDIPANSSPVIRLTPCFPSLLDQPTDWYDVSNVDGFNLPLSIIPSVSSCTAPICATDINAICPSELQTKNSAGKVVGYKSACLAFGSFSPILLHRCLRHSRPALPQTTRIFSRTPAQPPTHTRTTTPRACSPSPIPTTRSSSAPPALRRRVVALLLPLSRQPPLHWQYLQRCRF
ncbi:thaumatin [Jimgerdemannia flammicorona]|uniref:Thaumatin n=1 Tax=Jimgerdemannia flammicorona TaxID=994334 RepID=A0A433D8E9_9FUNG|nr:thaumatin [Jimgerdemannia flammicorona]